MDWKEKLAALADVVPQAEEPATEETTTPKPKRETVTVSIDRKQRKGKTATLIEGFECDDAEVERIAATLKQRLGTGGSCRGGDILIQGDCRTKVKALLEEMGHRVKMLNA